MTEPRRSTCRQRAASSVSRDRHGREPRQEETKLLRFVGELQPTDTFARHRWTRCVLVEPTHSRLPAPAVNHFLERTSVGLGYRLQRSISWITESQHVGADVVCGRTEDLPASFLIADGGVAAADA